MGRKHLDKNGYMKKRGNLDEKEKKNTVNKIDKADGKRKQLEQAKEEKYL
jgi:hypothetical protein